jgi:hypothetical protein
VSLLVLLLLLPFAAELSDWLASDLLAPTLKSNPETNCSSFAASVVAECSPS